MVRDVRPYRRTQPSSDHHEVDRAAVATLGDEPPDGTAVEVVRHYGTGDGFQETIVDSDGVTTIVDSEPRNDPRPTNR